MKIVESLASCALCDRRFGVDQVVNSREHIIQNFIGGQKKVRGILCKDCNDRTGKNWDSVLAQQLAFVSHLVKVKRDRGENPTIPVKTWSGRQIRIHADGSLSEPRSGPRIIPVNGGLRITGKVQSIKDAEILFRGLKRKYPKFDAEGALTRLRVEKTYVTEPVGAPVYIDGDDAGRSIVKSAYVLAVHSGVKPAQCELAREYLKEKAGTPCWWFYYDHDLFSNRPTGRIFHCVAVRGNPRTRQIVGYVELFGAYRMLMLLSSEYDGKDFINSYAIDPTSAEELKLSPKLDLRADEVVCACSGKSYPKEPMVAAVNGLMAIAYPMKVKRIREAAIEAAFRSAWVKLDLAPGGEIGPEHVPLLTHLFMKEFKEYLMHQIKTSRPLKK